MVAGAEPDRVGAVGRAVQRQAGRELERARAIERDGDEGAVVDLSLELSHA
jgi:hypothetical protein